MDDSETPTYPVSLLLTGRRCLVVGGGRIAARKVGGLVAAGASVTVVAPSVIAEIEALPVTIERRRYRSSEVDGYALVVTATGDRAVDGAVSADCERSNIFVNAADDPDNCSFILPAIGRAGPVSVAVSTSGASPALAVWLRDRVVGTLPHDVAHISSLVSSGRAQLRAAGVATEGLGWPALIGAVVTALEAGDDAGAHAAIETFVSDELARDHLGVRHHAG